MKPNCYECAHRRSIPGDAHSRCAHPEVGEAGPVGELLSLMGKQMGPGIDQEAATKLGISGDVHGYLSGWFNWPWNFDPTWLKACNGFERTKTLPPIDEKIGVVR